MTEDAGSWKISLPCTQAEAQAIAALELIEALPVLLTREIDPAAPDRWVIEAYLAAEPDDDQVARFQSLVPSAANQSPVSEWIDRKSTRLNSSHIQKSRMPSSA